MQEIKNDEINNDKNYFLRQFAFILQRPHKSWRTNQWQRSMHAIKLIGSDSISLSDIQSLTLTHIRKDARKMLERVTYFSPYHEFHKCQPSGAASSVYQGTWRESIGDANLGVNVESFSWFGSAKDLCRYWGLKIYIHPHPTVVLCGVNVVLSPGVRVQQKLN